MFQNRSSFIENLYIDNLQYDTVLVNFFALKLQNFNNILLSENINCRNHTHFVFLVFTVLESKFF
nr:DUF3688 family protein [Spiroplasma kunkelii]